MEVGNYMMVSDILEMGDRVVDLLEAYKNELGADDFWHGRIKERKARFKELNSRLNRLFGMSNEVRINFNIPDRFRDWHQSGNSNFNSGMNTITLDGRLSLLTFIHEWAHVLGMGQGQAIIWSQIVFQNAYPDKWDKLQGTDFRTVNGGNAI